MTTPRQWHTATLLPDGKVLIVGGYTPGEAPLGSAEIYDPDTGIFTRTGDLNQARIQHSANLLANGKVLMACGTLPVPAELERYTEATITDHAALAAELAGVRASGFATAVGELEEGLVAVAAPVLDSAGACVAALSVSGPAFRLPGS